MLDEILVGLFGQWLSGRLNNTKRAQLILRIFFGLIGGILSCAGAYHIAQDPKFSSNMMFQSSIIALFIFFGCFWIFNVALGRKWKWPWMMFAGSLIATFVTRIAFG